jgi:hypothetical protein
VESRKIRGGVDGGSMGGGVIHLCGGIVYCGLVRIMNFFFFLVLLFYDNIMFVKVMNVTIFHCVHTFTFFCAECIRSQCFP